MSNKPELLLLIFYWNFPQCLIFQVILIVLFGAYFILHSFYLQESQIFPTTKKDLVNEKCLMHKDIKVFTDYLIVSFRWSKTIQFGERVLETPLVSIPGSVLCPVTAYHNMCIFVTSVKLNSLFLLPNKKCIFYRDFQAKLKFLIHKIELNPDEFSSHSFRRGGCSFCFKSDVPSELIQLHGDWRSDAYKNILPLVWKTKLVLLRR